MSDRLHELKRQRAAVAEHLAWLDREIAAQAATSPASTPSRTVPAPAPQSVRAASSEPASAEVDAMFDRLREEEQGKGQISRQGCWTVFSVLLLIGLSAVGAVIYFRYR